MNGIFIICAMVFLTHYASAQNKITGKVTDPDNLPLAGANIYIPDMNKGTIANEYGKYELLNLPNGKIQIQFSFVGYANYIKTIELNGANIELSVTLKPTVLQAEEIVVSGGYNSTQHENAVKIDVLKSIAS